MKTISILILAMALSVAMSAQETKTVKMEKKVTKTEAVQQDTATEDVKEAVEEKVEEVKEAVEEKVEEVKEAPMRGKEVMDKPQEAIEPKAVEDDM